MAVDFASVRANAAAAGVPPSEIAVIYKGLTAEERIRMNEAGLIAYETEGTVIARLADDGNQLFGEKAVGVYSLSA
jgi:hypothetical protein